MERETMRVFALFVVSFVLTTLMLNWAAGQADSVTVNMDCPQEDSCYVDYYDGEWHVIRGEAPWLDND